MSVFVDTSALMAAIVRSDLRHAEAASTWRQLNDDREPLVTTNCVVLELVALLQRREGLALVSTVLTSVLPLLSVHWMTPEQHGRAFSSLVAANRRDLSLVDCTSFAVMRDLGVTTAFALDPHFGEQGFSVVPAFRVSS